MLSEPKRFTAFLTISGSLKAALEIETLVAPDAKASSTSSQDLMPRNALP
jgi:hypothetical protein